MRILELSDIRSLLVYRDIISLMRDAVISWSRGECEMPMPMHLSIAPGNAEVHMKSCYRRGGSLTVTDCASGYVTALVTPSRSR